MSKSLKDYLDIIARAEALPAKSWAPDDPLLAADIHDQIFMNLVQAYNIYFTADRQHPQFHPIYNSLLRLQPNPDDTYYRAPLEDSGTYRLYGERGGSRLFTLTLCGKVMGETEAENIEGQTAEYDFDEVIQYAPDGTFDIILSAERPAGYDGQWLHMPAGTRAGHIRQRCYDWGNEKDARFGIERLDVVGPGPRPDLETLEERLTALAEYAERHTRQWLAYQDQMRTKQLFNKVEHHGFSDLGGVRVQVYWWGIFQLEPDEAIIVETDVPQNAPYWNVQLNDQIFNTLDYVWHQSSLNGHQARLDSDGKFRAVLSISDPGVPNWLDTVGRTQGSLVGRWYKCATAPVPVLTKVKLAQLRDHLPSDTPHVSPQERDQALRARARGAQLRRKW